MLQRRRILHAILGLAIGFQFNALATAFSFGRVARIIQCKKFETYHISMCIEKEMCRHALREHPPNTWRSNLQQSNRGRHLGQPGVCDGNHMKAGNTLKKKHDSHDKQKNARCATEAGFEPR